MSRAVNAIVVRIDAGPSTETRRIERIWLQIEVIRLRFPEFLFRILLSLCITLKVSLAIP